MDDKTFQIADSLKKELAIINRSLKYSNEKKLK